MPPSKTPFIPRPAPVASLRQLTVRVRRALDDNAADALGKVLLIEPSLARQTFRFGNTSSTLLIAAAEKGQLECLCVLVPYSSLHQTNDIGQGPLLLAASHGHLQCVRALLEHLDPMHPNAQYRQALVGAAEANAAACVQALLPYCDRFPTPTNAPLSGAQAALIGAFERGSDEAFLILLKTLLDLGQPLPLVDGRESLFVNALKTPSRVISEALLPLSDVHALSVNSTTLRPESALMSALWGQQPQQIQLVLDQPPGPGNDVHLVDAHSARTPMDLCTTMLARLQEDLSLDIEPPAPTYWGTNPAQEKIWREQNHKRKLALTAVLEHLVLTQGIAHAPSAAVSQAAPQDSLSGVNLAAQRSDRVSEDKPRKISRRL